MSRPLAAAMTRWFMLEQDMFRVFRCEKAAGLNYFDTCGGVGP
jgi:hypothetical protein